jgi:hypothetical protein
VLGIPGPKRGETTGGWRKSHNEDFYNLYSSSNTIRMMKSRMMKWAGHVAQMRVKLNAYMFLVGRLGEDWPLEGLTHSWKDTIKVDLKEKYNRLV